MVTTSKGAQVAAGAELLAHFAGPLGLVVASVRVFAEGKVRVPSCPKCWSLHRRGLLGAIGFFVGSFVGVSLALVNLNEARLAALPPWLLPLLFAAGAPVLVLVAWTSAHLTMKATSVKVYRVLGDRLRYEFWSPAYHDYLKRSLTTAAPSPSQAGIAPSGKSPFEPKA